jgi:hypothetical protein
MASGERSVSGVNDKNQVTTIVVKNPEEREEAERFLKEHGYTGSYEDYLKSETENLIKQDIKRLLGH